MLTSLFTFVQILQKLSDLPLEWPLALKSLFAALAFVSLGGYFSMIELRLVCLLGSDWAWAELFELFAPATPVM